MELNDDPMIRDFLASAALQGMLAHPKRYVPSASQGGLFADWHKAIASEAYELADAMLQARGEV